MNVRPGLLLAVLVSSAMCVTGCATTRQSSLSGPIKTVADATVRRDVMWAIGIYESAAGGSANPSLISAERMGKEGSTYEERWIVQSNGAQVPYSVKLTAAASGGVDYAIARLQ